MTGGLLQETIVNHILSLYAGKVAAFSRDDKRLEIRLDREAEGKNSLPHFLKSPVLTKLLDHAVYIDTSTPGITVLSGPKYEQRIDEKYLNPSNPEKSYRVESFRSSSQLTTTNQQLRCYFVYKCDFVNPSPNSDETDLDVVSDKSFLQKVTPNTKAVYQDVVKSVMERTGPVIEMFEVQGTREKRLVIGFKQGSSMGLFSALSDLYHYYGCTSARKYVGTDV